MTNSDKFINNFAKFWPKITLLFKIRSSNYFIHIKDLSNIINLYYQIKNHDEFPILRKKNLDEVIYFL